MNRFLLCLTVLTRAAYSMQALNMVLERADDEFSMLRGGTDNTVANIPAIGCLYIGAKEDFEITTKRHSDLNKTFFLLIKTDSVTLEESSRIYLWGETVRRSTEFV